MATDSPDETTKDELPLIDSEADAFPTREQLADTTRPDPFDFDEPSYDAVEEIAATTKKSGAPDKVDESDATVIQDLVRRAAELGMQDDEVAQIKEPGALRSVIAALERQAKAETSADFEEQTRRKSDAGASPSSEYEALAALDPDDAIDPAAIKAIKALKAELDKVRSRPAETTASEGVRPEEADYLIAKLGDDFVDLFGDGPANSLSRKSAQYKARTEVVQEMKRIQDSARSAKRKVPESKDAFDQALRSVFGDKVKQAERRELATKVKARQSQLISRPSSNGAKPVSGRERAIANVAQILRDRGRG